MYQKSEGSGKTVNMQMTSFNNEVNSIQWVSLQYVIVVFPDHTRLLLIK